MRGAKGRVKRRERNTDVVEAEKGREMGADRARPGRKRRSVCDLTPVK